MQGRDVRVVRALCDGCDPRRPGDEYVHESHVWLVTAGAFELRDRTGDHVMDPTTARVLPQGVPFAVRHPSGPDTCLSLRGSIVDELAAGGARELQIDARHHAELVAACRSGDPLAVAESLVAAADPETAPVAIAPRDRVLADDLAYELRVGFADATSLGELAGAAGASVFHACRVFRRATGHTIHGYRRELRLRHALAMLIDGDAPLAEIAATTGFASQSHLTNLFRARFRRTPGRVRATRRL